MTKQADTTVAAEKPTYADRLISTDHTGGKLVFSTDRPDGQKVRVIINGRERTVTVQDGQIWVRTSQTDSGCGARITAIDD